MFFNSEHSQEQLTCLVLIPLPGNSYLLNLGYLL